MVHIYSYITKQKGESMNRRNCCYQSYLYCTVSVYCEHHAVIILVMRKSFVSPDIVLSTVAMKRYGLLFRQERPDLILTDKHVSYWWMVVLHRVYCQSLSRISKRSPTKTSPTLQIGTHSRECITFIGLSFVSLLYFYH